MTTPSTSRRIFLAGVVTAPAALAAGSVPGLASTDTPMMALFRQWEALMDKGEAAADANPDRADEEWAALTPELNRISEAMEREAPTDLRDLAAKIIVVTSEGGFALPDEMTLECAAIAGRDFAKLPQCLFKEQA